MNRSLLILLFMILPVYVAVSADAGTIHGIVVDNESGDPIPGATVMIEGTIRGASTDSVGYFEITGLSHGKHKLSISSIGFVGKDETVQLPKSRTDYLKIELERTPLEIGGIVVTGTRTPRFVKDSPVHTEVITKSSIEKKSAGNIFEALDGESGIRVEEQCQACNFSILRMQGLGADHTQILLDGQPVYSGLASVYGLQQMSTADVDQIEIVKGASSALYGSNAIAGAINIISTIPYNTQGKVNIEFGQYGTRRYDITAGTRKDKASIFIFAQHNEQKAIDQTGDVNAPGGVDNPDGWIDRVKSSSENLGFNLFVDNVFASDQITLRGRVLNENRQGGWLTDNLYLNRFAPGTEGIITDRYSGQMSYRIWLKSGSEINAEITMTHHNRDASNDTFLSDYEEVFGTPPDVTLLQPYIAEEQQITANLNYVRATINNHRLLTGIQINHDKLNESGMYVDFDKTEAYLSTSNKRALDFGAYFQDEFKPFDNLELVGGIRFDYHNSKDEFHGSGDILSRGLAPLEYNQTSFNPRFSFQYMLNDEIKIRGSFGTGYRVPYGFSEDLHLCSGSPRVYKGGDLKPERSLSYSLNADYFSPELLVGLNLYRTELRDAIGFVDADETVANLGYNYEWKNIDDAFVMGLECNVSYALIRDLALNMRLELFKGKYDSPRSDWIGTIYEDMSRNISRYPGVSGGLGFEYSPAGWSFVFDADFKGQMYIDLAEPEDEYDIKIHETEEFVILNVKISKTFSDKYQLYGGAKNLTDYTQREKHISDAAFMYAPVYGRIVYGGVRVSL